MIRRLLVAAFFCIGAAGAASADDSAFVADYLRGLDNDLLMAQLAQPPVKHGAKPAPVDLGPGQRRYKQALSMLKTDAERRALGLHWAQMQTCADLQDQEARAGNRLDYIEAQARTGQCKTVLASRAAELRAAASAKPAATKKLVRKN